MRKSIILKLMVSVLICLTVFLPESILAASKPATPAIKSASGSATSITVKWNKVSGATKYKLQWRPAGGDWDTDGKSKTVSDTSCDVTGLNEGKLYWFRLYAINDAGTSGKSPNLGCYTTPKAPTASIVDTTSIKVNWSSAGGNTRYELLYRKSGEEEYRTAGKFDNQYTHTVTGLTPGAEYYFKIKAYNLDDTSVVSGRSDSGHGYTKLNAPWINGKSANTVSLEWSRNSMDGQYTYTYRIRRKASYDADYTNIAIVSGASYTDTGLQPNTSYAYYIDVLRNGSYCVHSNVLYVTTDEIYAQSISLNETSLSLEPGQTYQLYGNILPADTTNKNITWSSSDSNIVKADNGYIAAIVPGTAYVTATTSNGCVATCVVTVEKPAEVYAKSISLNRTSLLLEPGQTDQLFGNIYPENTTNKSITWSSSDENVATVSESGLVTAIAYGKTAITATTSNGHTATSDIFVLPPKDDDGLTWFLDNDGTLIIGGGGKMNKSPWRSFLGFFGIGRVQNVIILQGVTSINDSAFYDFNNLKSITIPNSVTSIGDRAFSYCRSLTSITIPDSVTNIGDMAFETCDSLTSITIPDGVTSIGDWAFSYCRSLTSITIPDSVTSIGYGAFEHCTSLTSIIIPDSVTLINVCAFENCTSLTSITIPDSVTCIVSGAFKHCTSLTSINVAASNNVYSSLNGTLFDKNEEILISYPCGKSGDYEIPDSVTSIDDSAFYGCSSLTSITIPSSVTGIGDYAFCDCTGLTSIAIPDSVTSIGNMAFFCCTGLKNITIPNSVTSIRYSAFSGCSSLTSITIPSSVTSIGDMAFYGCIGLTSITIPDSVTSIGNMAFFCCTGLKNITIPNSVTSIDDSAFKGCSSLTDVYYTGTSEQWDAVSVGSDNDELINATIHYNAFATSITAEIIDNKATATIDILKPKDNSTLYFAVFDNQKLVDCVLKKLSANDDRVVLTGTKDLEDKSYQVKFFVWDENMTPCSSAVEKTMN